MTSFTASAPGKVILLGEYAVLAGATALVAAVDRRARVSLTTNMSSEMSGWTVDSASFGIAGAHASITAAGEVHWDSETAADQLGLVTTVLGALHRDGLARSARISLDTHELYTDGPLSDAPTKLGLGSSAALTVALAGALAAAEGWRDLSTDELLSTHRRLQDGRGSGIDVAAAVHGGVIRFTPGTTGPQVETVTLPSALRWCCVWTGRPALTRDFLTLIAEWRRREPDRHDFLMYQLAQTSAAGVDAVQQLNAAGVLAAVDAYALLMEQLGEDSGADIVCVEHRRLAEIAGVNGVSYKSCGAGGGDIGMAFATEPDRLITFKEQAEQAGFHPLDLAVDPLGFSVKSDPS